MAKLKELKILIAKLNTKLLEITCFENHDFNGYQDSNFELYFKDFFYKPLLYLQYERPYLLFDLNNDRYRVGLIKELDEYKNLHMFLKHKYHLKDDKTTTITINYSKFIIYYVVNLIKKFDDWGKKSTDILYKLVKEFVLENENFEDEQIRIIATKRYILSLMNAVILTNFTKILINDIVKKEVKSILRYDITNLDIENSISINPNFSIFNSSEIPYKEENLIKLVSKKENGIIELSLNIPYLSTGKNKANYKSFENFINRTFRTFKYQEISFNALLLYMPAPLKIKKEMFYMQTFQSFTSSEVISNEIFFLSRYADIGKEERIKINKNDKNNLLKLTKLLKPISDWQISQKNCEFILIALKFFKDAMTKNNKSERMSYCVQALEAIYNIDGNQVARSISQRLAIVFSLLKETKPRKFGNVDPVDIQSKIKKAYDVRSKYVHGATSSKMAEDLLDSVVHYTQISIIVSLAILTIQKDKINKKIFNENLDNCLISKKDYELYKQIFKQIRTYL